MFKKIIGLTALMFFTLLPVRAHERPGFGLQILVDESPLPQYSHAGKLYIEALKGREYSVRLTNPLGTRVAVALAVDGLNSIDARNTDALSAKKWVLEPYQSIVISGWQVNQQQARRFFFTSEEKSYGQWLGKTSNLGVITAVFFKERQQWDRYSGPVEDRPVPLEQRREKSTANREADSSNQPKPSSEAGALGGAAESKIQKKDEYAATGIGKRMQHEVQWVSMDLDPAPAATLSLRYEFRPVLVKLGILPAFAPEGPLSRREQARGFKDSAFCPEPR